MRSRVAGKSFNAHGHINYFAGLGIGVISFLEFRADLKSLLQCHADGKRYHLRELVALRYRHIKNSCNVLYGLPCGKCTESNNVRNSGLAVFLRYIVYCYLSSFIVEVDIEVRH